MKFDEILEDEKTGIFIWRFSRGRNLFIPGRGVKRHVEEGNRVARGTPTPCFLQVFIPEGLGGVKYVSVESKRVVSPLFATLARGFRKC
jgi:hypothetical protein